jgi:hypothetical protein
MSPRRDGAGVTARVPLESVPVGARVRVWLKRQPDDALPWGDGVVTMQGQSHDKTITRVDDGIGLVHGRWLAEVIAPPDCAPRLDEFIRDATEGKLARLGRPHEERWGQALHLLTDESGWVGADCRAFVRALVADLPPSEDHAGLLAEVRMTVDYLRHERERIENRRGPADVLLLTAMQVIRQAEGRLRDYVGEAAMAAIAPPAPDPRAAEVARLRAALERYGRHTSQCALRRRGPSGAVVRFPECTCGLADALKEQR